MRQPKECSSTTIALTSPDIRSKRGDRNRFAVVIEAICVINTAETVPAFTSLPITVCPIMFLVHYSSSRGRALLDESLIRCKKVRLREPYDISESFTSARAVSKSSLSLSLLILENSVVRGPPF